MLHRALREWGYACDVIAPSLIPKRPGVQRKHDKRDATDLARLGARLARRLERGAVTTRAWKAQQRLHQRFMDSSDRKRPQIAVVAVARELVGFLWAVMHDLESAAA